VDRRLAELRELGASVVGVGTAESFTGAEAPLNLLEPDRRERPAVSGAVVAARSLAVLAGVLLLAALVLPLWQKRSRVIELLPRLATAKAGADVAERLGQEIEKLAGEHNFVLGKKQAQVPMVSLVEELSRLLPDTTWIQQLEVKPGPKGKDLQFFGETGSSSQLIEVLEKSGIVANPTFRSPLTKGVTPGTERFFIGAELKARPPCRTPFPKRSWFPPPKEPAAVPAAAPTASPAPATSPAAPHHPAGDFRVAPARSVATPAPNAAAPAKPAAMPPQAPAPSASAPPSRPPPRPADPPKGAAK
jgi:Tfp pilus assembly protein PilN